jgi:hypothetical protein
MFADEVARRWYSGCVEVNRVGAGENRWEATMSYKDTGHRRAKSSVYSVGRGEA